MSEKICPLRKTGGGNGGGNYPWKLAGRDEISVDLVGTAGGAPSGTFTFRVCYASPTDLYLISKDKVNQSNWATACNYVWSASFAAGVIADEAITVNDIKIPSYDEYTNIVQTINGNGSTGMQTSTANSSTYSWQVRLTVAGYNKTNTINNNPLIHFSKQ